MFRTVSAFLFLLFCATALPQAPDQPPSSTLKSFHDDAMNVTYYYPSRFAPVPPPPTKIFFSEKPDCVRNTLFANSVTRIDTSSFWLSTIDGACPDVLHRAIELGPFIREHLLRQLKQYGQPTITQEPTRYSIDGRPAAIALASVQLPAVSDTVIGTTYAAKACVLSSLPVKAHKKNSQPASDVLCFDFMTQNADVLNQMLSFIIQFDNDPMVPMVQGSVLRLR